jgi:hypothetical protein
MGWDRQTSFFCWLLPESMTMFLDVDVFVYAFILLRVQWRKCIVIALLQRRIMQVL